MENRVEKYDTITEAIEICRKTYRGRTYNLYEAHSGERLSGTAAEIYGEWLIRKLQDNDERDFLPVDDDSLEDWVLVETIDALEDTPPMQYPWEFAAEALLNQIVAEAEGN